MGRRANRLAQIGQQARTEADLANQSTYPPTLEANTTFEDDFAVALRAGIIQSLQPFMVGDDGFSRMLFGTLKRMLERADTKDLVNVLDSASNFCKEMEPFRDQYRQLESLEIPDDLTALDAGRVDTDSGSERDGSGDIGGSDEVREIDLASFLDPSLLASLSPDEQAFIQQSISSRYEAEMESDESGNREVSEGEIQSDGAG